MDRDYRRLGDEAFAGLVRDAEGQLRVRIVAGLQLRCAYRRMNTIREKVASSIVSGRSKVKGPVGGGIVHGVLKGFEIAGLDAAGLPSGTGGADYTKTPPRLKMETFQKTGR